MAFTVVYDACVLFPAPVRDLLIRVAHAGLVRARWSDAILDEWTRSRRAGGRVAKAFVRDIYSFEK